jgi:hypothetical protein
LRQSVGGAKTERRAAAPKKVGRSSGHKKAG